MLFAGEMTKKEGQLTLTPIKYLFSARLVTLFWTLWRLWWAVVVVCSWLRMLITIRVLLPVATLARTAIAPMWLWSIEVMTMAIATHEVETHITRINNYNNSLLWTSINRVIICHCTTHCHHR